MKIPNYLRNSGLILLLICLFALCIRVWFFVALQPWDEQVVQDKVIIADSARYHTQALDIITKKTFANFDPYKTPGYSLIIAFIYFIFAAKPWIVLFLQLFLDTGIVIIVYFIAKEIFKSPQISLIAAFLYSISFLSAYYSVKLLTEIPFTFVLTLGILILIKGLKKDKPLYFALTGLLIGLTPLIRTIAQYFPLVLIFVLMLTDNTLIRKLRNIAILLILFVVAISPWQFRNLQVYGHYSLSNVAGQVLLAWNVAAAKAEAENINRYEAEARLIGNSLDGITNPFERSKIKKKIAVSYILRHPLQYAKYSLKGIVQMFLGTGRSGISDLFGIEIEPRPFGYEPLADTAYRVIRSWDNELPTIILFIKQIIEYLFLIIGLVIMCMKDKKLFLLLLVMTIFYFVALTGPVGYSRYRIPIIPFYLIISAVGIFETFKFAKNKIRGG